MQTMIWKWTLPKMKMRMIAVAIPRHPVVLRLEGKLSDDLVPALSAMKKIPENSTTWVKKVIDFVAANSGSNAKLCAGYMKQKLMGAKVAKGYSKAVDAMIEKLGPDEL